MAYKVERPTKEVRQRRMKEREERRERKKAEKEERRMQRQASKGDRSATDDVIKASIRNRPQEPELTPKEERAAKRKKRRDARRAKAREKEIAKAKKMGISDDVTVMDIPEPDIQQEEEQTYEEEPTPVHSPSPVPIPIRTEPSVRNTDPGEPLDNDPPSEAPKKGPKTEYETVEIGPKETYIAPPSADPDDYEKAQELFKNLKRGPSRKQIPSFITDSEGNTTQLVIGSDNRVRPMSVNLRESDGTEQPATAVVTAGTDTEDGQIQMICPQCKRKFVPDFGGKGIAIDGQLVCRDCEARILAGSVDDDTEERVEGGIRRVIVTPLPEGQEERPVTVSETPQTDVYTEESGESEEYIEELEESDENTEETDEYTEESDESTDPGESDEVSEEGGLGPTPVPVPTAIADPYEGLSERERRKIERKKEKEERRRREKEARDKRKNREPDPDSFGEKFRRWQLITFDGYVKLRTLYRDDATGEFVSETTLVKKRDLPHDAVQCTGEKNVYCHDKIKDSDWYNNNHYRNMGLLEYQFTASDAALYMQSNKIDNALAVNWTQSSHKDPTKTIILMGAVLVVAIVVVTRFM